MLGYYYKKNFYLLYKAINETKDSKIDIKPLKKIK